MAARPARRPRPVRPRRRATWERRPARPRARRRHLGPRRPTRHRLGPRRPVPWQRHAGDGPLGAGRCQTVSDGLGAIVEHDPNFDREAFLDAAQRAFFVVQEAWTDRKPEMSRQVMADGLWQQHRVQIKGYEDEHKRNILGDLAVGNMDIVTAHSDASYDTIIVRVRAACSDYDVADDSGKVIRGNKRVGEWAEDWTFQRSSKATTNAVRRHPVAEVPQLRGPAQRRPGRRLPVLQGAGHVRRLRLGAGPDLPGAAT